MKGITLRELKNLLGPMRPPFLVLTPACVLLGLGTAMMSSAPVSHLDFVLVLAGALAAHLSVNTFNEYFDFKSGLDDVTERTPFSGGSGTLPVKPGLAGKVLVLAVTSFVITALIGVYFLYLRGLALLPLGLLGLVVVVAYTSWITRHPVLCLIAPGLGFGPLMVMGTHFVLTGEYSWTAFIVSLVPFFLVNDLLLLNQFPDVEADRGVGRKHFPVLIGRRASSLIYGLFLLLSYLSLLLGVALGYLPQASLMGLVTIILAVAAFTGAYRHANEMKRLIPYMGLNVAISILTPVLVTVGLLVGA